MKKVARNFKKDSDESDLSGVRFSIVAANNHYAGFGPGTVKVCLGCGFYYIHKERSSQAVDDCCCRLGRRNPFSISEKTIY